MKKKIAMNRDLFTHTITPPEKAMQAELMTPTKTIAKLALTIGTP